MKTKINISLSLILLLVLTGSLFGCFYAPAVEQYTLSSETSLRPLQQKAASMTVLVGPVKLASYLDQPRMVRRYSATRIDSIANQQWAGDLAEMIGNKLVVELGALLTPSPVYVYPGAANSSPGRRVAIDILRFEGTDASTATIEARWILFDLVDKSIIKTQASHFQVPLTDGSYEALATALSQGLTMLGQEIAEATIAGTTK